MNPASSILTLLLALSCATSPAPTPSNSSAPTTTRAATELFDFHIGFWVNLHQRLYAESDSKPPSDSLHAASVADQETWNGAVELYRHRYADRAFLTLLENEELVHVNRRLAATETATNLAAAELPIELRAALEAAANVYRKHRWPLDERAGHEFRDRLTSLLVRSGPLGAVPN